jgi:hypothetical protein
MKYLLALGLLGTAIACEYFHLSQHHRTNSGELQHSHHARALHI